MKKNQLFDLLANILSIIGVESPLTLKTNVQYGCCKTIIVQDQRNRDRPVAVVCVKEHPAEQNIIPTIHLFSRFSRQK